MIKPGDDFHYARSRLLCLENTQSGKVLPLDYLAEAEALADEFGLAKHLDGARLFNASVALGVEAGDIARHFDTTSFCLSKGLGAPAGTMLCGPRDFIEEARRNRKMLGGAMRQVGVLAAAGLHVLEHHVERLADDHANAKRLGKGFEDIEELGFGGGEVHTNMLFVDMDERWRADLQEHFRENGILISSRNPVRFVTHLDIDEADIDEVVARCKAFFARNPSPATPRPATRQRLDNLSRKYAMKAISCERFDNLSRHGVRTSAWRYPSAARASRVLEPVQAP